MKNWSKVLSLYICLAISSKRNVIVFGIVNLHQETANPIFYRRIPPARSQHAALAGVRCLDEVSKFYFVRRESLSRSSNTVVGLAVNMSTPADEIRDKYLELLNKITEHNSTKRNLFQLRVISDTEAYNSSVTQPQGALRLADYYVIVIDSVPSLVDLINISASHMSSWNPGARFLILYNNMEDHAYEQNITMEIYEKMLHMFYIHRTTILFAVNAFDYALTSLDYFSKNACGKIISRSFGFCRNGILERNSMQLQTEMEKMQNHVDAFNCTFNVCATIAAPFVEVDCATGLELRIIGFIRNRLHLNVITNCSRITRGVQHDGETWSGLLGQLRHGKCDFIIGGYYPDNDVSSHFWTSDCYYDDKHTWFIKKAEERPPWMALYIIFDEQSKLCVLLTVPLTWLSWFILARFLPEPKSSKELSLIGINNMALTICVAVNERPLSHAVRIFWFALSLYGMNIVAIYTSRLISVFANPGYLYQIDNIEEVIKAGIPFGGLEESHDWFDNEDDMWIYDLYNDSSAFEPNSQNLRAVTNGEHVMLSNRMYIMQNKVADKLFAFPRNVFSSPMQMIMKPGFPFMYEINWLIRYMRDVGIFEKYKNNFIFNNTYLNRIAKMRPDFPETQIVITMEHLQGPFAILIFGLSGSCLLFFLEICCKSCSGTKKHKKHSKAKANKRKKRTTLKKRSKRHNDKVSERKNRHTENIETMQNPKFAFVKTKFGTPKQTHEARIRFTPLHRRNVFRNSGASAEKDALKAYSNRNYC